MNDSYTYDKWQFDYSMSYANSDDPPYQVKGWQLEYCNLTFEDEPFDGELPDHIYQAIYDELVQQQEDMEGEAQIDAYLGSLERDDDNYYCP